MHLKEVRQALLSADVHFKVAKEFIQEVQSKCVGQAIIESVSAREQVIKIINDSLVELLGADSASIEPKANSNHDDWFTWCGKTTSTAKLARLLKSKSNYVPALIACDIYRPAAIDQLELLAKNEGFIVHSDRNESDVSKIAKAGLEHAKQNQANCILFDTAGRLQIDDNLISEIQRLKKVIQPDEILLVADSALGQEAVNVAKTFHEAFNAQALS